MIDDPVAQWRELSALYEQADQLSGAALRAWIVDLPAGAQRLVPRLERMLAARDRAAAELFLEALPPLSDGLDHEPLAWGAGRRIGAYRLVRHAGSGGMAEVWLAERDDGAFSRTVAIKLLRNQPARAERDGFVERFRRERDILASLDHPNIAGLHDAGVTAEGQPWLTLEFVEGEAITTWCDRHRLTIEDRVKLFRQVLLAVEHAHARLVMHRDIKPSNVLVTASGVVSLLDFGIAKLVEAEGASQAATALTRQGGRPLTPQYASPEQFLGEPLTTACDVYSLGVMLYELLVGQLPYELKGKSLAELEAAVVDAEPPPPSRRNVSDGALASRTASATSWRRALKPDLDAIVMRALEKTPTRRYDSVGAMRAELDRWLMHEPVLATLPGPAYRLGKFVRRHRWGVGLGTGVTLALLAAVGIVAWQSIRAQQEAARAVASKDFLLDMFHLSDPNQAKVNDISAGQLLDSSVERADTLLAAQPQLHADVLMRVAQNDQYLNRYRAARDALKEASTLYASLGLRKEWATAAIEIIDTNERMGDVVSADEWVDKVLPTLELYADDPGLQARQHEARGWLAMKKGDLPAATTHMLTAVAAARLAYRGTDSRTADSLRGLAAVEAATKDYGAARRNAAEAVQIAGSASNASTTDKIDAALDQAKIEFLAGEFAAALPLMNSVVERCDRALGSTHENCISMRAQRALLLIKSGSSRATLRDLPALRVDADNELSPQRQVEAKNMMVRILSANGQWADAHRLVPQLEQMVHGGADTVFSNNLMLSTSFALAELDIREGHATDAIDMLDSTQALLGVEGGDVAYKARALMLRGVAQQEEGHVEDASTTLQAAELAYASAFGPDHTQTLLCRLNRVPSMIATGQVDQALGLIDKTVPTLTIRLPKDAPVLSDVHSIRTEFGSPDRSHHVPRPLFFN